MARRKIVASKAISKPDTKKVKGIPQKIDDKPVWRFSTVDKSGPFAWPKGEVEELTIVGKLHDFDSMTWNEIEGKQHHLLSTSCLSKEALDRL